MQTKYISFNTFILALVLIIFFTACHLKSSNRQTEANWIQLFNGKDLNNWQIKFKGYELGYNYNNTFRVEDGLLRVRYDEWDELENKFGHIFYKGDFSHYRLRVEYRFVGEQLKGAPSWTYRNNGVMVHGQSAESMELNQDFPVSIEVQLLGGNGIDESSTMNVCSPGTNIEMNGKLIEQHVINSTSKTYHGDQWVTVEVEVCGGEIIRHFVDGTEVLHYEKPQLDPRDQYFKKLLPDDGNKLLSHGTISLQAEGHPTDFRKIELLDLSKKSEGYSKE